MSFIEKVTAALQTGIIAASSRNNKGLLLLIFITASQILQGARFDPDLLIANAINIFDHRMQYATTNHRPFESQIVSNHGIFST